MYTSQQYRAHFANPVVKFADQLIDDHPGSLLGEERVPALYDFVQSVRARGRLRPREMLELADWHSHVNFIGKLPPKILQQTVRRALLDAKRGVQRAPFIVVDDDRPLSAEQVAENHRRNPQSSPEEKARYHEAERKEREQYEIKMGSDIELARFALFELRRRHGQVVSAEGAFWHYSRFRWAPIEPGELLRFLYEFDGLGYGGKGRIRLSKARVDSVLHTMAALASDPHFFRDPAPGINCRNGFIMFDADGEPTLVPHHPSHRARHRLPGRWWEDSSSYAPNSLLDQLLIGCFGDDSDSDEKYSLMAEIAGCVALGYGSKLMKPKAIVLHGQSAEEGKSQILDMLRGLLPSDAICSIPPDRFNDDSFACQLAGKLLNASDETGSAIAIGSDAFKAIVTGEPIAARDLYKSMQSFRPIALHVLATNTLPGFQGGFDRGVQRRLLVVSFNRTVPEAERIEHIGARIATEEPDLLLAFAVEGACSLIARRQFLEPESSAAALRDWIFGADPVLAWLDACALVDMGEKPLPKQEAYEHFRLWARREGFNEQRLPAVNNFVIRVKAHDTKIGDTRNRKEGRCFTNLKIIRGTPEFSGVTTGDVFD